MSEIMLNTHDEIMTCIKDDFGGSVQDSKLVLVFNADN